MRILQIVPALNEGGVERGAVDFALYLKKTGHHPIVASQGGRLKHLLDQQNIPHIEGPFGKKSWSAFWQSFKQLNQWLKEQPIDILHSRSRVPCWLGYRLRRHHKIPLITTCHGCHSMGPFGIKKPYNRAVVQGDRVIAVSQTVHSYLVDYFPEAMSRMSIVPRWVDTTNFHGRMSPQEKQQFKAKWGIADGRSVVLMPARWTANKGQRELLLALNGVQTPCNVVFMGKNDNKGYVNECKRLGSLLEKHRVHWLEPQTQLHQWYACADVVVAASQKPEPFGRIPLEAAACETWTIAPKHGGFCESIKDGITGSLYQPRDAKDLTKKLESVLQTQPPTDGLRDHAKKFSREKMCARIVDVYGEVLAS